MVKGLEFLDVETGKRKLSDLKLPQYNTKQDIRNDPSMYEQLFNSLDDYGYSNFITVNARNNEVLGGNQRYKVICDKVQAAGFKLEDVEITVILVDFDDVKALGANMAYNNIGTKNDDSQVTKALRVIKAKNEKLLHSTGFDDAQIDKMLNTMKKAKDKVEKAQKQAKVKEEPIPQAPIDFAEQDDDGTVRVYVNIPADFKSAFYEHVNEKGDTAIVNAIIRVLMA